MPQRLSLSDVVPFVAVIAGLVLSVWRFRADDGIGGLAAALVGMILMIDLAVLIPRRQGAP